MDLLNQGEFTEAQLLILFHDGPCHKGVLIYDLHESRLREVRVAFRYIYLTDTLYSDTSRYIGSDVAGSSPRWCMSDNMHRFVSDTRVGTDCRTTVHPLRPGDGRSPRTHQAPGLRQGAV